MKRFGLIFSFGILTGSLLLAQEVSPVTFNVGGGFTQPVGGTSSRLNTGWNVDAGVGANFNPWLGAMLQFNFNQLDINSATLNALGFPDGNVRQWSVTLDPVIHTNPRGPVDLYFIGGGGLYHRTQEFTAPTTTFFRGFDPFFGFFYTAAVPTNTVLASMDTYKPGFNVGAGLTFGKIKSAKFYAESRWHHMFLNNGAHTDMIPVTFGVRF